VFCLWKVRLFDRRARRFDLALSVRSRDGSPRQAEASPQRVAGGIYRETVGAGHPPDPGRTVPVRIRANLEHLGGVSRAPWRWHVEVDRIVRDRTAAAKLPDRPFGPLSDLRRPALEYRNHAFDRQRERDACDPPGISDGEESHLGRSRRGALMARAV